MGKKSPFQWKTWRIYNKIGVNQAFKPLYHQSNAHWSSGNNGSEVHEQRLAGLYGGDLRGTTFQNH